VSTKASSDAAPRFRADPADCFRVAQLDEFAALYHRRSGVTHIISEPVPEILAALADQPRTIDELLDYLSTHHKLEGGGEIREALVERLAELELAGLVFRP
jgi:PqqD family protein of HPr-rel-A system